MLYFIGGLLSISGLCFAVGGFLRIADNPTDDDLTRDTLRLSILGMVQFAIFSPCLILFPIWFFGG